MINESREGARFARPEDDPTHPEDESFLMDRPIRVDGSSLRYTTSYLPSPVNDSLNPISSLNLFRAPVISTFPNHAIFSPGNRLTIAEPFSTVFFIVECDRRTGIEGEKRRYRIFLTSDLVKAKRDSKFETSSRIVSTMIELTIWNRVYRMMDASVVNLRLGGSRGGFEVKQ